MYNELKTNIVQIEIDNGSGFCFGVTTAIKKAEEELAKGGKLYCLGDIVHNGMEVERLHEAGLITIDHEQMEELQGVKVLLRAHGEPPETYALAERNNIEIIDATCPVVLQLQRRIKKQYVNNPEAQIVIFGKNGHAEVLGLVGIEAQAAGLGCVFSDAVPAEVLLSSHAIQIPLSASNADWAAGLQRMLHQPCDRSAGAELIRQAGYDINIAAARLQQQYLQLGGQA